LLNFVFYKNFRTEDVLRPSKERANLAKLKEPFLKSAAVYFKFCFITMIFDCFSSILSKIMIGNFYCWHARGGQSTVPEIAWHKLFIGKNDR